VINNSKFKSPLVRSYMTEQNPFISTSGIKEWLSERRNATKVSIDHIDFANMDKWKFDVGDSRIRHETGRFFSIDGIRVATNWGEAREWCQPIINQPELGYLGILMRVINGVAYFLMQAKIEPGNIHHVQISPTIQATKSNYMRVHQGKDQPYLGEFQNFSQKNVVFDQLQSEHGARFLKKRNRNMLISSESAEPADSNYQWMTLGQLKALMATDNLVNMDTRTVISGIALTDPLSASAFKVGDLARGLSRFGKAAFESFHCDADKACYSLDEILSWFTYVKHKYYLSISEVSLQQMPKWEIHKNEIRHETGQYFRVVPVRVSIEGREVQEWCQPLVEPMQEGLNAFIMKQIDGTLHFLVQAKLECGNFDILELAPTVQCLTGSYKDTRPDELPYLFDVLKPSVTSIIHHDSRQSEEGGRFFREQNRYLLIEVDASFPQETHENYKWMTGMQLMAFLKFNNYINIQARSLIALLNFCQGSNEEN
jgi:dTDP-4-dehydro-6-deoxy-alpha-D-glucopyranose 2,3-dehydratase